MTEYLNLIYGLLDPVIVETLVDEVINNYCYFQYGAEDCI